MYHRRILATVISAAMLVTSLTSCGEADYVGTADSVREEYLTMTPEEIVASLTLEQKAAQMVQPAVYNVSEYDMLNNDYGSIQSQCSRLERTGRRVSECSIGFGGRHSLSIRTG